MEYFYCQKYGEEHSQEPIENETQKGENAEQYMNELVDGHSEAEVTEDAPIEQDLVEQDLVEQECTEEQFSEKSHPFLTHIKVSILVNYTCKLVLIV